MAKPVPQNTDPRYNSTMAPIRTLTAVVALLVLAAGIWTAAHRAPWDPDETRYLEVSREMLESRNPFFLLFNGQPYAHKPPLFFWILTPAVALLGPTALAGAVPSILGWILLGIAAWRLARAADLPFPVIEWTPAVTMTALLPILLSVGCRMDLLFAAFCTLALERLVALAGPRPSSRRDHLMLWAWLGLAVLTKGPLALVFVLLPPVFLGRRGLEVLRRAFRGPGFLLALVMVCVWLLPAALTGGWSWVQDVVIHQSAGRVVSSFAHREPWWYHLAIVPLTLLPWSLAALAGTVAVFGQRHVLDRRGRLIAIYPAVGLLFLTILSGKTLLYPLPLFPAACITATWWLERQPDGRYQRIALAVTAVLTGGTGVALAHLAKHRPELSFSTTGAGILGASLVLPSVLALVMVVIGAIRPAMVALGLAFPLFAMFGMTQIIPAADRFLSLEPFGAAYNAADLSTKEPGLVWEHLNPGYVFFTHRTFQTIDSVEELRNSLERGRAVAINVKSARRLAKNTTVTWREASRIPYRHTQILIITGETAPE